MSSSLPETKPQLLTAIRARLERAEYDVRAAGVEFLNAIISHRPETVVAEKKRIAFGECWRRDQLSALGCTVTCAPKEKDLREHAVYFLGLSECEPSSIPSCREWIERVERGDNDESNVQEAAVGGNQ